MVTITECGPNDRPGTRVHALQSGDAGTVRLFQFVLQIGKKPLCFTTQPLIGIDIETAEAVQEIFCFTKLTSAFLPSPGPDGRGLVRYQSHGT